MTRGGSGKTDRRSVANLRSPSMRSTGREPPHTLRVRAHDVRRGLDVLRQRPAATGRARAGGRSRRRAGPRIGRLNLISNRDPMTHWAEGQARTDLRDDLGNREAKGVRAFVAIRMNEQVEDSVATDDRRAEASGRRRPMGAAGQPAYHAEVSRARPWIRIVCSGSPRGLRQLATKTAPFESPRRASARFPTSIIRARFGLDCTAWNRRARARRAAGDGRG